ncbi:MAG: hypothetical protein B7Y80_01005 [Hyphomicrobium sp. 32-62-53]|nr:MAG: hypothetical protein B7Z29_14325 [Hyphomicrobium sp. 12-62-95]OYY01920.1 MAG: hypothetical protein B7Y80_01005 [Hyphomicrobium sp. 32-62-53]
MTNSTADLAELQKHVSSGQPAMTPEKIDKLAIELRVQLHGGSPAFRQAYNRLTLREVSVRDKDVRITGSQAARGRAAVQSPQHNLPAVLSFVGQWRARKDSNL